MIKIENVSTVGWEPAIRGARNPMNSWEKSDTCFPDGFGDYYDINGNSGPLPEHEDMVACWLGPNDLKLLTNLAKAGSDEAKFRRMIVVYVDITAPMYWWKEADTYKVGTVRNSCSTMHKIHAKEFTLEDFSMEHLISLDDLRDDDGPGVSCAKLVMYDTAEDWNFNEDMDCDDDTTIGTWAEQVLKITIESLNYYRDLYLKTKDKKYWWQMIQLLPSSYNQRATLMLNYEVLANMYHARKNHKLDEWREFCRWIETLPYAKELIVDAGHEDTEEQLRARFKSYENRIEYLEITMAKELYSRGMSTLDISEKIGIGESTIRKIVEENKS